MPQTKSFPVAQLSQSESMEYEDSPTSLVMRHVLDADDLIDQVYECMGLIDDCAFDTLKMVELEVVEELIKKCHLLWKNVHLQKKVPT